MAVAADEPVGAGQRAVAEVSERPRQRPRRGDVAASGGQDSDVGLRAARRPAGRSRTVGRRLPEELLVVEAGEALEQDLR